MKIRARLATAAAALLIAMGVMASGAQAHTVTIDEGNPYQDVGFVGKKGIAETDAFEIALAGTYQATLTDFHFPEPFDVIQLIVTSATEEYGRLTAPGTFFFNADPGRYFLSLWGETGSDFRLGLYGIEIAYVSNVAPVPLPPAALLLVSALGMLGLRAFRRRHPRDDGALALAA